MTDFDTIRALMDDVAASGDMLSYSPARRGKSDIIASPFTKREDATPQRPKPPPATKVAEAFPAHTSRQAPHEALEAPSKRRRISLFGETNIEGQTQSHSLLLTTSVAEPEAAEEATDGKYSDDTITTECRLKATQQVAMQHERSAALTWRYNDKDEMSGAFCDGHWFCRDELLSFSALGRKEADAQAGQ